MNSKLHLPRHRNPIILAVKAGIDPVGACHSKVSAAVSGIMHRQGKKQWLL
jgi:hypothetical protein